METSESMVSSEIKNLMADIEELLARVADVNDVDISRVRQKVQETLDSVKTGLADSADSAEDYVRDRPWQAIGIAALLGVVVGVLATRRS